MEEDIDFIFDKLGICGCGFADEQVNFIYKYLMYLDNPEYMDKRILDLIKDNLETVYELLGHFFAAKNIVEYGSSIRGCWLSSEGEKFLNDIKKVLGNEINS